MPAKLYLRLPRALTALWTVPITPMAPVESVEVRCPLTEDPNGCAVFTVSTRDLHRLVNGAVLICPVRVELADRSFIAPTATISVNPILR